jgi:hypothetical protein
MCATIRHFRLSVLVILAAGLAFGWVARGDDGPFPRPARDAISKAQEKARNAYKEDLAKATEPSEKAALATVFLTAANDVGQDDANQLVLIKMARDLAVDADDAPLAMKAVSALVRRFQPDGPTDPKEQIERGNASWKEAETAPADRRLRLKVEAAEWFLRAKPSATGLDKTMIMKRLVGLCEATPEAKPSDEQKTFSVTYRTKYGHTHTDLIRAASEEGAKKEVLKVRPNVQFTHIKEVRPIEPGK